MSYFNCIQMKYLNEIDQQIFILLHFIVQLKKEMLKLSNFY